MITSHEPAILCACLAIVGTGALTDLFTRKIPNILTFGGLALGILFHGAIGYVEGGAYAAARGALFSFLGALLCALPPFIAFVKRQMGGGDVKLFGAIGAMVGPSLAFDAQFATFLFMMVVIYPFIGIRTGSFQRKFHEIRAKLRGEAIEAVATAKPPHVILGPAILLGLCVAMLKRGFLPWC
jgi:prepilin peptidase CpaA